MSNYLKFSVIPGRVQRDRFHTRSEIKQVWQKSPVLIISRKVSNIHNSKSERWMQYSATLHQSGWSKQDFVKKHKPIKPDPDADENIDDVDLEIYWEEVEHFIQHKINMRQNLETIIWISMGSILSCFTNVHQGFNILWIKFLYFWCIVASTWIKKDHFRHWWWRKCLCQVAWRNICIV